MFCIQVTATFVILSYYSVYEAHFAGIEKRLAEAEARVDDAEVYSRRACLRIFGIPLSHSANESAEICISKVKEVFKR